MIQNTVQALINYAIDKMLIDKMDEICVRNMLMDALRLNSWETTGVKDNLTIDEILEELTDYAVDTGIIENTSTYRDIFDTKLMGLLTPMPSEVNATFHEIHKLDPMDATDWYYGFSRNTNYVRAGRIAKDVCWKYDCDYGKLDITINRSKPEKDPKDIAAAKNAPKTSYPKCQLCIENTGFCGTLTHPARQNLRPVSMTVGGGDWWLQYSPYGYYNEHCIVFNNDHVPMVIDKAVFGKLFDILEFLPHYFIGSNADLPIVGGSILSHEHFQGGRYTFPMETAEIERGFSLSQFPTVKAGIVKWPMSVIRISGKNRYELIEAADYILGKWRGYSDESAGIFAFTDDTPHNTVTPIARMRGEEYELDLVLRNNRTTEERPLGLFHPNPSLHHIKKENIGLIEVMGLAVLPARLVEEMDALAEALVENGTKGLREKEILEKHADWAEGFYPKYEITKENVTEIIHKEIGAVFEQVLLDAGVFKRDDTGRNAFLNFIRQL